MESEDLYTLTLAYFEEMQNISEGTFNHKPSPNVWNKKQILGHLIDSAANNHQPFIRAQSETHPFISYDQNKWNTIGDYQNKSLGLLLNFWKMYNLFLFELYSNFTTEQKQNKCLSDDDKLMSLEEVYQSYIEHLKHHLAQITA